MLRPTKYESAPDHIGDEVALDYAFAMLAKKFEQLGFFLGEFDARFAVAKVVVIGVKTVLPKVVIGGVGFNRSVAGAFKNGLDSEK